MTPRYSWAALLAAFALWLAPAAALAQPSSEGFYAVLSGANEVPANSSTATGAASATLTTEEDGAARLVVEGVFSGLASDFNEQIGAHIHQGAAGTNGPVIFPLTVTLSADRRSGDLYLDQTLTAEQVATLRAGNYYVNVHSVGIPAGEIRGQLTATQTLSEVREAGAGADVDFVAVVSRARGTFAYVEDGTAGLTIRQLTGSAWRTALDAGTIREGTVVRVRGRLSQFNNLLQINQANANANDLASFEIVSQTDAVQQPTIVTLEELAVRGEDYEGRLIAVTGVSITSGQTGNFSNATTYGIQDDSDASGAVALRIPAAADNQVGGTAIPTAPFVLVGVVSQFSANNPAAGYQIQPILARDINPTARVQVIHNAPDPAAATVDVYVNDTRALDDFAFRTATGYLELPALLNLELGVAPGNSASVADTLYTFSAALEILSEVQVIATGLLGEGFANNPQGLDTAFRLEVVEGRVTGPQGQVAISVFHGAPDAPAVDGALNGVVVVPNTSFGSGSEYLVIDPAVYTLGVRVAGQSTDLVAYTADLSGAAGQAVTVLASGFLNPEANQNGPAFGLLAVFANGQSALLPVATSAEGKDGGPALALGIAQNPVRGGTEVRFSLGTPGDAELVVYDALGRRVSTLASGAFGAEGGVARLEASGLASGVYVVRLSSGERVVTRTITVIR